MAKKIGEIIYDIIEEKGTNKILIFTNHLQFMGYVCSDNKECKNLADTIIPLKDVKVAKQDVICNCTDESCEYDSKSYRHLDWFNVNTDKITGFSVLH